MAMPPVSNAPKRSRFEIAEATQKTHDQHVEHEERRRSR